jgi:uncharacterized protein (DUF305 family)
MCARSCAVKLAASGMDFLDGPGRSGYADPSMIQPFTFCRLLPAVLLAACASGAPPSGQTPAHSPSTALPATTGAGYTISDVRFMQHMIGHHAQAVVMAALAPAQGASAAVLRMAQKIDISQRDEIAFMRQWLTERNQVVPDSAHAHHMMMPGMLTAAELQQLSAARGRDFDRLFLSFMIRHHQGALQMVAELFETAGAGQDPDLFRFVTDVDADQRDEIYALQQLLETIRQD